MATKNDKKKGSPSMTEYMMKRAAMGGINAPKTSSPATTPVFRQEPMTQSQQDSMAAYIKYRQPQFKPKGQPKKYIKDMPASSIKIKKK
jgi:hypothetical protein